MVMLREKGKATKIAQKVMRQKGVKVPKAQTYERIKLQTPYLQH